MEDNKIPPQEQVKDIRFEAPTFIDPLTGIFNRYYLYQFLPEELKKAKLSNYPLSFLMIDLDGFKQVNDNYGHLCGDQILKEFAKIFKNKIRSTDSVIRYAGDEFALIMPTVGIEKARELSNQIIKDVNSMTFKGTEGQELHLTLSIGYAVYPLDAEEVEKLIDSADKALYLSKQKGKNRVCHAKEVTLETTSSLVAMDSFPCRKFIDREEEFKQLQQAFDGVNTQSLLKIIFLRGETGVGKTRLLNEIRNYLNDKATIIHCSLSPKHAQDPYHLISRGLNEYLGKAGVDTFEIKSALSNMPFEERSELSLLVPQLAGIVKNPFYKSTLDNKARFLLFKAFLDFFAELNKFSVIIFTVDDIQFADKASLELLRYLIKQEKDKRILIVSTLSEDKSGQIPKDSNLQDVWREFSLSDNFVEMKIANLSLENIAVMVNAIFSPLGDQKTFIELLYRIAGGNPGFTEEILKSLLESGIIIYENDNWRVTKEITEQDIPNSLEDLLRRRIKNIDEETKEMILQAAVIGEEFDVDFLKKLGDKDEAFIFELINRAKKMRIINESNVGNFNFANKNLQRVLYNEIAESQRNDIHYKVAQALAARNKNNLLNVAGELAFHFGRAPAQEDAAKFNKVFSTMTEQLFDSNEILESLEGLAKEIISGSQRNVAELSPEAEKDTLALLRSILGVVKNFHLYPPQSSIRTNSIKESFQVINNILVHRNVECVELSEVERSLVINTKRFAGREHEDTYIEDFLYFMMGHNIKAIAFLKGLREEEMSGFFKYVSMESQELESAGGWKGVLAKDHIEHVQIDELSFSSGAAKQKTGFKGKLQDAMLMEFLLGKVDHPAVDKEHIVQNMKSDPKKFAEALMEIAERATSEGKTRDKTQVVSNLLDKMHTQTSGQEGQQGEYTKDLAKVVAELDAALRNQVIRSNLSSAPPRQKEIMKGVINVIPDELIVDIITDEYANKKGNLLETKEFINEVLSDEGKKKEILPMLESKLSKLNIDKEDAEFLTEQIKWQDLNMDKKIENLVKENNEGVYILEIEKIKDTLVQLDSSNKRRDMEEGIRKLLLLADRIEDNNRRDLILTIEDFEKDKLSNEVDTSISIDSRAESLLALLKIETDQKVFSNLLEIFRAIIVEFLNKFSDSKEVIGLESPLVRRQTAFINSLFCILNERLKSKSDSELPIRESIKNFVLSLADAKFLDILIYSLANSSSYEMYEVDEFYKIIGDKLIDGIINFEIEKSIGVNDLFKRYVMQSRIIKILIDLGQDSLKRIKILVQELGKREDVNHALIELMGYMKNDALIEDITPFLAHNDAFIRRTAILALGEIGSKECDQIILKIAKTDKDKKIRALANEQLKKGNNNRQH